MNDRYHYVFGPVPSRRFGRSLGIDLIPHKTCTLDCVYCQLGRTRVKTVERKAFMPVIAVLDEIEDWFQKDEKADYITLSGSGEPTLHKDFGVVLRSLKPYPIPSVLLTNGTLLHLPEVRDAASHADIVKVSLNAWNQNLFNYIHRPHPEITFELLMDGLKKFRAQFHGQLWMEVFLVLGLNSMSRDVENIAERVNEIRPDRVHLNTVVRPPAEDFAAGMARERMEPFCHLFNPPAEVISEFNGGGIGGFHTNEDAIMSMLRRRPCTSAQIAKVFGLHLREVAKYLDQLMRDKQIRINSSRSDVYYSAVL